MTSNLCVTNGIAGFIYLRSDHGIEQENRKPNVNGGITGIAQVGKHWTDSY